MATGGSVAARRTQWGRADDAAQREESRPRRARTDELAWIGVLPCAALVLAAIVVLGPALGRILFPKVGVTFWPVVLASEHPPQPEPTEHARFLIALTAPLLLAGFVLLARRRLGPLPQATIARLVLGAQVAALAFLAVCYAVQHRHVFRIAAFTASDRAVYFTIPTLLAAGAIALAIGAGLASERVAARFAALARETHPRRAAALAVGAAATTAWLLPAINFEHTIAAAHEVIVNHTPFWLDEVFSVLDNRPPLVHFAAQYGSLWPYPIAGAMALFGSSIGTFTIAMASISAAAMLATLATFRRVAGGTVAGLLLFLPFLATAFFMMEGPADDRYGVDNLFGTFPLRYAGPLLVAWLLSRHLAGARPRRLRWLFVAAGLAVLNNVDFGVPALGATIAALLCCGERVTPAYVRRLALEAAIGLAGAYALVSVLTLAVAGSLPHLELLVRYSRLFALAGWGMLPMTPTIGMSTIIYLTYVAAIGVAVVRALDAERDRLMTGLLAWSGVFGLGAGSYYMGRSHPEVLTNMFGAWALSVTLLFALAVRSIAARPSRRPTLVEAACLLGFGVLACSLAQVPTPWSQIARLERSGDALYATPVGEPFMAKRIRRGEPVAILTPLGHRAAYNLGVTDVTPYTGVNSMPTVDQLDETLAALRAAGGFKVFLSLEEPWPGLPAALVQRGYRFVARERYGAAEFSSRARPSRTRAG